MSQLLSNVTNVLLCAQALFTIIFVIAQAFTKDTECDTCRQRRLWKENVHADAVLRHDR